VLHHESVSDRFAVPGHAVKQYQGHDDGEQYVKDERGAGSIKSIIH